MLNNVFKVPEKLQLYGLCVYYVVHICDIGMLRVKDIWKWDLLPLNFILSL